MEQDQLRERLLELKKIKGISYSHICRSCNIPKSTMALFMKSKRSMRLDRMIKINNYLDRNYSE